MASHVDEDWRIAGVRIMYKYYLSTIHMYYIVQCVQVHSQCMLNEDASHHDIMIPNGLACYRCAGETDRLNARIA